jgi:hypothetical protein
MKALVQLMAALAGTLAAVAIPNCKSSCEEQGNCGDYEPDEPTNGGTAGSGTGGGSGGSTGGRAGSGNGGTSGTGATGGDGGLGGEGGSGGGGGECDSSKSPSVEPCIVSDEFAVFVSSDGDDGDLGTMAEPVATFERALELAAGAKIVVACSGTYDEHVEVSGSARIYGGFDCAGDWTYSAAEPSRVEPMTRGYALRIETTEKVVIEDATFTAQAGMDAGESSIGALVVDSSDVTLRRVTVTAGPGADGGNGDGTMTRAATGAPGNGGTPACSVNTAPNRGGSAVETMCDGAGSGSVGGKGGDGGNNADSAGNGNPGQPMLGQGAAGLGEVNTGWNCGVGATLGGATAGGNGTSGQSGIGARGLGELTANGYDPVPGNSGENGDPGQGGGGGGGAKAPTLACALATNPRTGASAGSGGGGGCGGKGGMPGKGGGASIGLASIESSIILEDVELFAAEGGGGGDGGPGQPGGLGGPAGPGAAGAGSSLASCPGAQGGQGGNGGDGGGGAGGPSLGIAHIGGIPAQLRVSIDVADTAAPGGADGSGSTTSAGAGAIGILDEVRAL